MTDKTHDGSSQPKNVNVAEMTEFDLKSFFEVFKLEMEKRGLDTLALKTLGDADLLDDLASFQKELTRRETEANRPNIVKRDLMQAWSAGKFDENAKAGRAVMSVERIEEFVAFYTPIYEFSVNMGHNTQKNYTLVFQVFQYFWSAQDLMQPEKVELRVKLHNEMRDKWELAQKKAREETSNVAPEIKH